VKILRWWAAPAAVMATTLVAACGGGNSGVYSSASPTAARAAASSPPATAGSPPAMAALARQMKAVVAKATSVHVTAAVSQGGTHVTIDLSLTRANDMYGQMSYQNKPFTVLVTQGHTYIKVTAATLKAMGLPSAACVLMCNKYLKMGARQSRGMTGRLDWPNLVGSSHSLPPLRYVRATTVHGQPAWEVRAGSVSTVYLAAQGHPYPLRVVGGPGRIDFTPWNSVTIPPPPPASQVVDISQLKHL